MSTYVIGDIQGCFDEFLQLLDKVQFEENRDELWLVGDLVNRGPKNIETLLKIMSIPKTVTVLGNHDLHLLAIACGVRQPSASDTIDDVLSSRKLGEIIDWLRSRPLIHTSADGKYVLVHAGLLPIWSVSTCIIHAQEVSDVLKGDSYIKFLSEMYGNRPLVWSDSFTGFDRLRLITNCFTRLRYCTSDGELELESKETNEPAGYSPWFDFERPDSATILFGHWAALNGKTSSDRVIALDTGCVWGRLLTAYRLEDGKRFSIPSSKHSSTTG